MRQLCNVAYAARVEGMSGREREEHDADLNRTPGRHGPSKVDPALIRFMGGGGRTGAPVPGGAKVAGASAVRARRSARNVRRLERWHRAYNAAVADGSRDDAVAAADLAAEGAS